MSVVKVPLVLGFERQRDMASLAGLKGIAKATGGGDVKNSNLSPYMFVRSIYVGGDSPSRVVI